MVPEFLLMPMKKLIVSIGTERGPVRQFSGNTIEVSKYDAGNLVVTYTAPHQSQQVIVQGSRVSMVSGNSVYHYEADLQEA